MKHRWHMFKVSKFICTVVMLSVPAFVWALDPSDKELKAMEEHWGMVTNESDAKTRKTLIEEHRTMMSSYSNLKIPRHDGPMDDIHSHDREMHIKNTVIMHTNMMDMMQ